MERYWQPEMETASRETLTKIQSERLVALVKRVYDNVPLYRERMDNAGVKPEDIHSIADLGKLPLTSKQDLRDTYPYGLFAVPLKDVVRLHASSGTTGKQIVVGYTKNDLETWSDICARQLTAAGAGKDDIIHVSYGYGLFTGGFGIHGGAERIGATVVPVSSGNTERQITIMHDFGCTFLCCTPSYAMYLAETIEKMGVPKEEIKLRGGIFGAEPWTKEMCDSLEQKLGIKAFDVYGLTEIMGPGVAFGCSEQNGLHVNEDHFIIECIDPETEQPVPDGQQGELVFTCLTKEAFPLVRFRTRDIGVLSHEACSCGRTFVKMSKPMGRTDDMLIIRGVNVFPSQIETVLLKLGYSPNYEIIVDRVNNTDTFDLRVEMTEDMFSDTVSGIAKYERTLTEALKSTLGIGVHVVLAPPHTLKRSEGKAKRVIDKRKETGKC
ncbi:MAG: phenylacetate--CoA ligase [Clostridia bacterium]|nr:phenylacetate--CoA ligase [Clostridia bacterium]